MQHYENPAHIDTDFLLGSIKTLFRYVDHVVQLNVLGGEPFTNTDLAKILKLIIGINKAQRIVVITNGTIRYTFQVTQGDADSFQAEANRIGSSVWSGNFVIDETGVVSGVIQAYGKPDITPCLWSFLRSRHLVCGKI